MFFQLIISQITEIYMSLAFKYPFLKKVFNYKLWGIVLLVGVLLQLYGFYKYSFRLFTVFSGVLLISIICWLFYLLVNNKSVETIPCY